jgi:L-seryl-tRNA(Ser) seleniumtransferase
MRFRSWDNFPVKKAAQKDLFRLLPSVDELMHGPRVSSLTADHGHAAALDAVRAVLEGLRREIGSGKLDDRGVDLALLNLDVAVERQLRQDLGYSLRPVVNATGVILHTNLGRAPLAEVALEHVRQAGAAYSNLEFDLTSGNRGQRDVHVDHLFRKLLGDDHMGGEVSQKSAGLGPARTGGPVPAQAAVSTIVVNNNAAAVLLALNTLAEGGEVIVSRGELVEIGGSFRIPDVMTKSGAILREVGTTNRTRISDYERAINERTRLLLRVHRSNFEITGFTEQPAVEDLVTLSRGRGVPVMEDLGSGALFDLRAIGISGEPGLLDRLRSGVDIVTYSGDKLLGGPQAGLISGRQDLVARMRSNSLFRALRVDKLTYAALEATLLAYVKRDHDAIPALRMMRLSKEEIGNRAEALRAKFAPSQWRVAMVEGESIIGGGAAPSAVLPTRLLALRCKDLSAEELAARLRTSDPPVIARVEDGQVLLDLRTVFPEQDGSIADVVNRIGP